MDHLDSGLVAVVHEAFKSAFSVQSDFARREAEFVAMASSLGLISTKVTKDVFSRHWRPTVRGLMFLESLDLVVDDPDESLDDISLWNTVGDDDDED